MNTTVELVYAVQVEGRLDGLYLFRNPSDAARFQEAVQEAGGAAEMTEEPVNQPQATDVLIEQELAE